MAGLTYNYGRLTEVEYESEILDGRFLRAEALADGAIRFRGRPVISMSDTGAVVMFSIEVGGVVSAQGMDPADAKAFGQAIVEIAEGLGA